MAGAPIDEMIAFALEGLLAGDSAQQRALVRRMCLRWPDVPALSVSFALTSAAAMIDDTLSSDGGSTENAARAYRMAAVFAADVYAAEALVRRPAKAQDLLHFWRRVDPYFMGE